MTELVDPERQPARYQRALIGRGREQALLRESLENVLSGRGSLMLVSGEAGIGKTTLVRDLVEQAEEQSVLVLTGGCYDLSTTPPYGPWIEISRAYPTTDDTLPILPDGLRQGGGMDGIGSQTQFFELIHDFFVAVRESRPLLLVLEDLHWSDPASLELLRYLGRSCAADSILLIVTYRDDELTRQHPLFQLLPLLVRETAATRIELQRFTSVDIQGLVARKGLPEADTVRLAAYLNNRTGGNPLFATELLLALETEGTLDTSADGMQLGDLDEEYLPSFILQVIEQRLARLGAGERRALEMAAVIGQEVSFDVWDAVNGLEPAALDATIQQALATHILEETPDHQSLRFTHALIREVLYAGVIPTRRRVWHRLTAETLMASPDPDPDAVAFHLEQASDSRHVDWLIRAGERADRRQAQLMAAEHFDRAQALLKGDPQRAGERAWLLFRAGLLLRHSDYGRSLRRLQEAEAVAWPAGRPVIAHLARAHKGLVTCFEDDYPRGLDDMHAGILGLEDLDTAARAELDGLTASLSTGLGVLGRGTLGLQMADAGKFQDAQTLLEDWHEREWETSPDAWRAAGTIHAMQGQPALARKALTHSQGMYEALNEPGQAGDDAFDYLRHVHIPYEADNVQERHQLIRVAQGLMARDPGVSMPVHRAETLWAIDCILSGDWNRADTLLGWRQRHDPTSFGFFDPWRLQLARLRGDSATVWDTIHRRLPDGPESKPGERRYFELAGLQVLAVELALDSGQTDEARSWLEAHDRLLVWSGAVPGRAENGLLWARYHLLYGDLAAAHRHATQAFEHASNPHQPLALIAAHRTLGDLDTRAGRHAEAERQFQQSLDLSDACATPFERALTLLGLARLRASQGQAEAAIELLGNVRAICEPLKATPTLEQTTALETELHEPSVVPTTPFGLTPRELDVLRLVSEGLTDAEVAERLFVSRRTVTSHLTSIYTRLGVSSRTAATRFAIEHNLA
ncbi:hypothetical protein BH23CHL1_BH23CHL1_08120 [soil metagenome]